MKKKVLVPLLIGAMLCITVYSLVTRPDPYLFTAKMMLDTYGWNIDEERALRREQRVLDTFKGNVTTALYYSYHPYNLAGAQDMLGTYYYRDRSGYLELIDPDKADVPVICYVIPIELPSDLTSDLSYPLYCNIAYVEGKLCMARIYQWCERDEFKGIVGEVNSWPIDIDREVFRNEVAQWH